jgi:cell division protein FtsZ
MSENAYNFDLPTHHKSIIKVIGVGGGGSNAVIHMYNQGIKDVEFVICNTDVQALKNSPIPTKLQIGVNLTEGLGAGANPEKGKNAAIESKDDIRDLLVNDTKMLFITAGMGGGTGTGAAPIIAKVARDLEILTVGIVTVPFAFEGKKKMEQAMEGINELKSTCDTVLVILNDKLREIHGNLSISQAFGQADNVLTTAAKGIAEIITVPGYVNVDFQDVRTVMANAGAAVMGSATTEGENRAKRAAEEALMSPLLNNQDIHGAQKILLSIISGDQAELQMDELTEITEYIQEMAGEDAEVIFGHGVDPALEDSIRVTVITTGFESIINAPITIDQSGTKVFDLESTKQIDLFEEKIPTHEVPPIDDEPVLVEKTPESEFERGYFFSTPESSDELDGEDGLFDDIGEEFTIEEESTADAFVDDNGMFRNEKETPELDKKAEERKQRLKDLKAHVVSDDEIKAKIDVPAYLRKKVVLHNTPHSSERNISKFNLNEDNQLIGNNRFLHDNVD